MAVGAMLPSHILGDGSTSASLLRLADALLDSDECSEALLSGRYLMTMPLSAVISGNTMP